MLARETFRIGEIHHCYSWEDNRRVGSMTTHSMWRILGRCYNATSMSCATSIESATNKCKSAYCFSILCQLPTLWNNLVRIMFKLSTLSLCCDKNPSNTLIQISILVWSYLAMMRQHKNRMDEFPFISSLHYFLRDERRISLLSMMLCRKHHKLFAIP